MSNQSEAVGKLFAALATVQAKIRAAGKNATNPHLRNKYADLGSVWEAWQEFGPAAGLAITQLPTAAGTLRTVLGHSSGEWIESETPIQSGGNKGVNESQAYGSGLAYARRYALAAIAGIYAGDDDDAASAGAPGNRQAEQQETAPPAKKVDPMERKLKALFATLREKDLDPAAFRVGMQARYGYESTREITPADYGKIMSALDAITDEGADILAKQAQTEEQSA